VNDRALKDGVSKNRMKKGVKNIIIVGAGLSGLLSLTVQKLKTLTLQGLSPLTF
jgi:hypothetical protein